MDLGIQSEIAQNAKLIQISSFYITKLAKNSWAEFTFEDQVVKSIIILFQDFEKETPILQRCWPMNWKHSFQP